MANVITGRQWTLDTVGVVYTDAVFIRHIEYVDYAVSTEAVLVKDRNGRIIFSSVGHDDFTPVVTQDIGWCDGVTVTTLAAPGKVIVYIK
jgi:hypothetical protein